MPLLLCLEKTLDLKITKFTGFSAATLVKISAIHGGMVRDMVNRCQVCGRPVAGHRLLGCAPGFGNCKLTPLSLTEGGISSINMGETTNTTTTANSPVVTSAPIPVTSVNTPVTSQNIPPVSSSASPAAGPSSQHQVNINNQLLESQLTQQVAELEAKVRLAEAQAEASRYSNIQSLYKKQQELSQKLALLCPSTVTPPSSSSAPPPVNPFAPPTSSAGVPATSFGVQALSNQHQLGQTVVTQAIQAPLVASAVAQSAISSMSTSSASFPGSFINSSLLRGSLPDLHSVNPVPQQHVGAAAAFPGSLAHAQSLPNINMASMNPENNPFLSPDDFYSLNPIAMAMLGMQSEARSDALRLGKYLPELFALKYAKLEDIRKQMSYQEFVHMYCRMLIFMLRDDPHLVPERLVFLYNIAAKAVKHRWSDVRNVYAVALQEMRHRRRGWAQDFSEIVNDMNLPTVHPGPRGGGGGPQSAQSSYGASKQFTGQTIFTPGKPPCNDYNDKGCGRSVCKFDHRCAVCSQGHPAKYCPTLNAASAEPRQPSA